ncbi:MAG TPA: hypothetical protein V6C76_14935 [Drouetiella sp.]
MRKLSVLVAASISLFVSSNAAHAVATRSSNTGAAGTASFVTAPFQVGSQTLFSASIVNVSNSSLGASGPTATLSGNNAGSAPQGGLGVRQGGLGFASNAVTNRGFASTSIAGGTAVGNNLTQSTNFSSNTLGTTTNLNTGASNVTGGASSSSSVGFNSANNSGGLSSTGIYSGNVASGSTSVGFNSANSNGGLSSTGTVTSNVSGASSVGFNSANNSVGLSSVGQNSANNGTTLNSLNQNFGTGTTPVLVLTNLTPTQNPLYGSTGAAFQGAENSTITSISFQYGALSSTNGTNNQITSSTAFAPVLAIDDQTNTGTGVKTRYLPVTAGTLVTPTNGIGLTTVTFNANQLNIQGRVSHIGVTFLQQGTILVNNITVNNSASQGLIAQGNQTYPF